MRRGFKQIISYALIFMLAFSMSFHVNAEEANGSGNAAVSTEAETAVNNSRFSEISNHWAKSTLEEWVGLGLLNGDSNGSLNPDRNISRAEFIALVNRVMQYTEKSDSIANYTDVTTDKWYYNDCAIALDAGYIKGTSANTLSPDDPITREQAVTIISRIKGIEPADDTSILSLASDSSQVSSWAKGSIAAAIQEGLVTGSNGKINPVALAARCEAIVLLDRVRTDTSVYYFAAEYGPETGTSSANNVIIAAAGISLKNMTIENDLQIAEAVEDGDASLSNVIVKGDLLVHGGGKNSLYFSNITVLGGIVVRKDDQGVVRIVVSGKSVVNTVVLETGAILVTQELSDGSIREVIIPADYMGDNPVELIGNFSTVTNMKQGSSILLTRGSIETLNLDASATVKGSEESFIKTANIGKEAGEGTLMNIAPETVAGEGASKAEIIIASVTPTPTIAPTVTPTPTQTAAPGGSTDGGSGGNDNPPPPTYPTISSITGITAEVNHNDAYTLPEKVSVNLSNGSTANLAVAWEPSTASTAACGTFTFNGTVTLTSEMTNPSNLKAVLRLTVKPVLNEIKVDKMPAKVNYYVGEALNLEGLVIKGYYSDGTDAEAAVTIENITGYDPESVGEQTITVTFANKTASFTVTVNYEPIGVLAEVYSNKLTPIILGNGALKTIEGLELPQSVQVAVYEQVYLNTFLGINWDLDGLLYDPAKKSEQQFNVEGRVQLTEKVTNPHDLSLDLSLGVTVESAKYNAAFDLNGQAGDDISRQTISYGSKVVKPADPISESHDFAGWYTNAECTGEAFDFDNDLIENNVTLYAKWTIKVYQVAFNGNYEGAPEEAKVSVEHGALVTAVTPAQTPSGKTFGGWYMDSECKQAYDFDTPVTRTFTLYARWMDFFDLVSERLTFDTIKGENTDPQAIKTRLSLVYSFEDLPGVHISWSSSNTDIINSYGTVYRPDSTADDAEITLTPQIYAGVNEPVDGTPIQLKVLKSAFENIKMDYVDPNFVEGYPKAEIINGSIHVYLKLKNPAEVFLTGNNYGSVYDSSVDGVLHGHATKYTSDSVDRNYALSIDYVDYVNVIDTNVEYTLDTRMDAAYIDMGKINFVVKTNEYTSSQVTTMVINEKTQNNEGNVSTPYFYDAMLNDNNSKIVLWGYSMLKLDTTPNPEQFKLTKFNNEGNGTVTDVSIHNVDSSIYSRTYSSYIELTVADIVDAANLRVEYTKQEGKLKHQTGGECESFNRTVESPEEFRIRQVIVNPTAGVMFIEVSPYKITQQNEISFDDFVVKNNGTAINLKYSENSSNNLGHVFTFIPITSGEYNFTVSYNPSTSLKDLAFDTISGPITFTGNVTYVSTIFNNQISAEYTNNTLKLTFAEGVSLYSYFANCGFIIEDGDKTYNVRGFQHDVDYMNKNVITFSTDSTKHIQGLSNQATLRYDPHDQPLKDILLNTVADFGPIPIATGTSLESITAEWAPDYKFYFGQKLDLTALTVTGTYDDGSKKLEIITLDNISGYDSKASDEQTVTITVDGKTTTFYATVMNVFDSFVETFGFDTISGSNSNMQSVISDLNLVGSIEDFPGITISWASSNTATIANNGKVNRPAENENDVIVALTATISDGTQTTTKTFNLVVRKAGIDHVTTGFIDPYFSSGYPIATIEDGVVVLKLKLIKPAEVYVTADATNAGNWKSSVTGVLHGHATQSINSSREENRVVWVNFYDYANVENAEELVTFRTDIRPDSGRDIRVNFVIKDGNYLSGEVTEIYFDGEIITAMDETPPSFRDAYINDAGTKIYVYCTSENLDLASTPSISAFSLVREDGSPNGTVTAAAIQNNTGGYKLMESWIELTVNGIVNRDDLKVKYTAQPNKLQDIIGNDTESFTVPVESADIGISEVYVNAASGRIEALLMPNVNVNDLYNTPSYSITVTNHGNPVTLRDRYLTWNSDCCWINYSFDPILSNDLDFKVTFIPDPGAKDWAYDDVTDPIEFTGTVNYLPQITTSNITAVYNSAEHEITLTFAEGTIISGMDCSCAFTVNANGTTYQLRGFDWNNWFVDSSVIVVGLGKHIPTLSGNVTISYAPHDEGMEDRAGVSVPNFGPVPVTIQ